MRVEPYDVISALLTSDPTDPPSHEDATRSETRKKTSPELAVIMFVGSQPQAVRINFSCLEATQFVVFCYSNPKRLEQTLITSSQYSKNPPVTPTVVKI